MLKTRPMTAALFLFERIPTAPKMIPVTESGNAVKKKQNTFMSEMTREATAYPFLASLFLSLTAPYGAVLAIADA